MAYYDTYREHLASKYPGHALWQPDPGNRYDRVRVGDVGCIRHGHFTRFFNALLPAEHRFQGVPVPHDFVPLEMGHFVNILTFILRHGAYCSPTVQVIRDPTREQIQAAYVTTLEIPRPFC